MRDQALMKVSRVLLYATAVLPLIVWGGFTFPFVTIRTALFRIVIEAVLAIFLFLLARGRVRLSGFKGQYFAWIFVGLLIVESIAALLGESAAASFFGGLERMWGIFTVVHLFLFYVLARVFFGEREWRTFFRTSLIASAAASVYGILQRYPDFLGNYLFGAGEGTRISSTLGNPVYVAIYLLFNIAFAAHLLMNSGPGRWRYFYFFVIAVDLYAFTLTDIRGAYLGLLFGLAFAACAYVLLGSRRRLKQGIMAGFIALVIIIALGFQFKSSDIVRQIPVLRRVATISINDSTAQTRFIGWNAAWKGFLEDPLTGVGMENYNVLFNKYFPARYYLLAPTETYFDRAHNQFFNILGESGIIALLVYLAFPVFIGWYLARGLRQGRFTLGEFLLFGGLGAAYFVNLFFVFDDFHSLLFFAAYLALLEYKYHNRTILEARPGTVLASRKAWITAAVIITPLAMYSIFVLNLKVLGASRNTGAAFLSKDVAVSLSRYRRALAADIIPSENVTLAFVEYLASLSTPEQIDKIKNNPATRASALAAFPQAREALEREIKKKPNDAIFYLKLGQLNNSWFLLDNDASHLEEAIIALQKSLALSPERIQIYLVLGESYVLAGEHEKAVEVLESAVALEPDFRGTYYFLGRALLTSGRLEQAYDVIVNKGFIERGHDPEDNTIAFVLAEELALAGEYAKMVTVYEYLAKFDPKNARVFSALAAGYVLADRPSDAIAAAQKSAELDPGFAQEAASFIQAIEEGRLDELKQGAF